MKKTIKCFHCRMNGVDFEREVYTPQEVKCAICDTPYKVRVFKNGKATIKRTDMK